MKRRLSLILTIIICISIFAGMTTNAFPDVTEEHSQYQAITYLAEKGIINGYEDGSFRADNTITRAEFVKMLLESIGITNIYGNSLIKTGFTDVDGRIETQVTVNEAGEEVSTLVSIPQHWAIGYIKLAVDKRIVNGYGDGTFSPDAPVTYEEAIKMVVCGLGREKEAQEKASSLGIPLWPDAYLSAGDDIQIKNATDYELGVNATRSNVAQMLYNVKDVKLPSTPTFDIPGANGGGVIDMGGSGPNTNVAVEVSGLQTSGQVVAAAKTIGDDKELLIIDENIVINVEGNTLYGANTGDNYIVVKINGFEDLENFDGNTYWRFNINGVDRSEYLGMNVDITYSYNPNAYRQNSCKITDIVKNEENLVKEFDSENIKNVATDADGKIKITASTPDGLGNDEANLYTDDLDSIKVIYNNKLVVAPEGITTADLKPEEGNIKVVNDTNNGNSIDLIWINSYETYYVNARNTSTKTITDSHRGVSLDLSETGKDVIILDKTRSEKEFSNISQGNVLKVAQSKCGTRMEVTYYPLSSTGKKTVSEQEDKFLIGSTEYIKSSYFKTFVQPTLSADRSYMTLYYNDKKEVIRATVEERTYLVGYLIYAEASGANGLALTILNSSGSIDSYLLAEDATHTYITKAYSHINSTSYVETNNGRKYENLSPSEILASLRDNAATINTGKTLNGYNNAETAQPIRYIVENGKIISLCTYVPDTTNRFETESLRYQINDSGANAFYNDAGTEKFRVSSASTVIFVPNNRTKHNWYKIGSMSSLSSKFTENELYNIEPYIIKNSSNYNETTMFVVYNQDIDQTPTYRSENIIIKKMVPVDDNISITGYVAGQTKTYLVPQSSTVLSSAYVLDGNFERKMQDGNPVTTFVEVGDVIRLGYYPDKTIACAEIIFDANEAKATASKAIAVSDLGESMDVINPSKSSVYYYARMGEVTSNNYNTKKCVITINNVAHTVDYGTTSAYVYDPSEVDETKKFKSVSMEEIYQGYMLFVWQGENRAFKQIYAVKYGN